MGAWPHSFAHSVVTRYRLSGVQREYWTSARFREHLRFSTACCHTYIGADLGDVLPHEKGCVCPAGAACKPVTPLIGPQPWWASLRPMPAPDHVPQDFPQSWLDQEINHALAQFGDPSSAAHCSALKSAVRLHALASSELHACLEDFVYASQESYWHSVLLAFSRTLSAEHRGSEQPCSAGVAQQVGRWLMLRPAGLLVDTRYLDDNS